MSDSEDYDDDDGEEEEDSDEEEGSDEEGEDDEDEEAAAAAMKAEKDAKVMKDLAMLDDLSLYINRVSERMKRRFVRDHEDRLEDEVENVGRQQRRAGGGGDEDYSVGNGEFDPPVWQNYEQMDEADRASLLERAIMVLGEDRSEGAARIEGKAGGGNIRGSRTRASGAKKLW
jgi:hypothetical protein